MENFSALLLTSDLLAAAIIQKVLEEYGFGVKKATSSVVADQLIRSSRFDLAVYDNEITGAMQLANLPALINAPRIVFAMVRNPIGDELRDKRVHFMVQKPFTADLFGRSLRAAFGVMLQERRVAFRHPVVIQASGGIVSGDTTQKLASITILDISRTGLCFQGSQAVPQGATVSFKFQLPETRHIVHITGAVMWTRASGRAGVKFTHLQVAEHNILNSWLDSQLPFDPEVLPRPQIAHALSQDQARAKSI